MTPDIAQEILEVEAAVRRGRPGNVVENDRYSVARVEGAVVITIPDTGQLLLAPPDFSAGRNALARNAGADLDYLTPLLPAGAKR